MKEQVTIFIWKKLVGLLYPTWTNFSEKIFSNDFLSCFEKKYCAVSQNVIFMSFIYLHFLNCIFFLKLFVQLTELVYKKPLQLDHFGYKEAKIFWTKVWGGSLDFNISYFVRFRLQSMRSKTEQAFKKTTKFSIKIRLKLH